MWLTIQFEFELSERLAATAAERGQKVAQGVSPGLSAKEKASPVGATVSCRLLLSPLPGLEMRIQLGDPGLHSFAPHGANWKLIASTHHQFGSDSINTLVHHYPRVEGALGTR